MQGEREREREREPVEEKTPGEATRPAEKRAEGVGGEKRRTRE